MRDRLTFVDGLIDHHGNCRSLGAQWNQSPILYVRAGPGEKAAALDAAIEYEDAIHETDEGQDPTQTQAPDMRMVPILAGDAGRVRQGGDGVLPDAVAPALHDADGRRVRLRVLVGKRNQRRTKARMIMDDRTEQTMPPVDELLMLGERMKRDKTRLIELCRRIAAAGGEETAPAEDKPARRGRKPKKVKQVPDSATGDAALGIRGKARPEYWKKAACPVCGTEKGTRVLQGERFPLLHKNPETDQTCKGCFQTLGPA